MESNEHIKYFVNALKVLKEQHERALNDLKTLEALKEEALDKPDLFIKEKLLNSSNFPRLQEIRLFPSIDLEIYYRSLIAVLCSGGSQGPHLYHTRHSVNSNITRLAFKCDEDRIFYELVQEFMAVQRRPRLILQGKDSVCAYETTPAQQQNTSTSVATYDEANNESRSLTASLPLSASAASAPSSSTTATLRRPRVFSTPPVGRLSGGIIHQKIEQSFRRLASSGIVSEPKKRKSSKNNCSSSGLNSPIKTEFENNLNPESDDALNISTIPAASSSSSSYKAPWTDVEQEKLVSLLYLIPEEEKASQRYAKIAAALGGNRTSQQVASRVQKYFERLVQLGKPLPGALNKKPT